ncbi:hypothetical protein VTL71DRAFT_571 [Oculimacula yallundae]|uniref:Uncharacterized protein n=1 Tax=Oculimacula yallundae TaxID=86028 RepID=A0ABR4D0F7_9HELO
MCEPELAKPRQREAKVKGPLLSRTELNLENLAKDREESGNTAGEGSQVWRKVKSGSGRSMKSVGREDWFGSSFFGGFSSFFVSLKRFSGERGEKRKSTKESYLVRDRDVV